MTRWMRLGLLVGCIAVGVAVGWIGLRMSGSVAWFLAIPVCMALVWLAIANPSQCEPCAQMRASAPEHPVDTPPP